MFARPTVIASPRSSGAFTIIELLVVIAVIAIVAGVAAFSLGGSTGGGIAMQSAQANVLSMVSAARSTAALKGSDAGLFVNVKGDSDGFLRELQVAYDVGGKWRVRGSGVFLPAGVYIVPDPSAAGASTFTTGSALTDNVELAGGSWSNGSWKLYSSAMPAASESVDLNDDSDQSIGGKYIRVCQLPYVGKAVGTVGQITVAPAKRVDAHRLVFENPSAVRGVSVSIYGIASLLNDSEAMK